jgi:hypothetical protein
VLIEEGKEEVAGGVLGVEYTRIPGGCDVVMSSSAMDEHVRVS